MKRYQSLLKLTLPIILILFLNCSKDPTNTTFSVVTPNLLNVDNDQRAYQIGDTIWLNITVPNLLTDVQGNERNARELTGAQYALTNIKFFKENAFSLPAHLRLAEGDFTVELGKMELFPNETLMRTRAVYGTDSYLFRFGVILVESGSYFISTPSGEGDFETFFEVGDGSNNDFNVKTSIQGGDANNRFLFEVTD